MIGVKEAVAEGITALVGEAITNPVLWTADGSDFHGVDEYELHQLYTTMMEGAARPEATNIRRQYIDLAGTMFDFRETFAVNCERLAAAAMKYQGFGIVVHNNLTANILIANAEWAAGQSWGNKIHVAYRDIKRQYKYDHAHTSTLLKEIKREMAMADEERDHRKAEAPGEMADMVSQGIERLAQLLHTPPVSIKEIKAYSSESEIESAHTANYSTSGEEEKRGRRRTTKRRPRRRSPSPSPSTSRPPSPLTRRRSIRRSTSSQKTKSKK